MSDLRPDFRYRPVDTTPEEAGGTMFLSSNGRIRKALPALLSLLIVCVFCVIVLYAYKQGTKAGQDGNAAQVPIILADSQPYKIKPEDPGGKDVPYQDMLVLNGGEKAEATQTVRVINTAETPLERPQAAASSEPKIISLRDLPKDPSAQQQADHVVASDASGADDANAVKPAAGTPTQAMPTPVAVAPAPAPTVQADKPTPAPTLKAVETAAYSPTSGTWRVQLGSFREQGAANSAWTKLQKQNPELSGLSYDTVRADLGEKGVYYRVQAINLSQSSAKQLCDQLNARKSGSCLVVKAQ